MVRIGSVAGPGFISGQAGLNQVVRDGSGNFWIGDGGYMNVYGTGGEFIRTVGREGEGPMEFQWAYPFHGRGAAMPRTRASCSTSSTGGEVLVSFGAEYGPGDDPSDFNHLDLRHAATAPDDSIMVAHQDAPRRTLRAA